MTPRDWDTLRVIGAGPGVILPAELGRLLGVQTATAREYTLHLVGRGLVDRQRMADGQVIYEITEAGRAALEER